MKLVERHYTVRWWSDCAGMVEMSFQSEDLAGAYKLARELHEQGTSHVSVWETTRIDT